MDLMDSKLKLMTWNIHGHKHQVGGLSVSKFADYDFTSILSKFDIFSLTEIHAGPDDDIDIPGYFCSRSNRSKSSKATKYSGGVAVFIREKIKPFVELLPICNNDIVWIKVKSCFLGTDYDLYICTVYISPENSRYTSDINPFEILFNDICKFSTLNGKCLLMGDFNAATNTANDYVMSSKADNQHIPLPIDNYIDTPLMRNNSDKRSLNNHGKSLIDLCIAGGIRILNGRKLGDMMGNYTCYSPNAIEPTCIDYIIADTAVYYTVKLMSVHPFTWYSDHCSLSCEINCQYSSYDMTNNASIMCTRNKLEMLPTVPKWQKSDPEGFKLALETVCKVDIENFMNTKYDLDDRYAINKATEVFTNIIHKAGKLALTYKKI